MKKKCFVKCKRFLAGGLATLIAVLMLPSTGWVTAADSDTVTVKSQSFSFSYYAGGTWTSDLDGFSVSDGSLAICTQLDVNPPGSGGATYKLSKNLGTSYTDGDKTIDTKFAFKCLYYTEKHKSTSADLSSLNVYELTLAANCVARGYFSNLGVSDGKGAFSQKIIRAVQSIRRYVNADADNITTKISIKDGIATLDTGDYIARMALFSAGSDIQRVLIYNSDWQKVEVAEYGAVEVYKQNSAGQGLSGAIFTVYDVTGNRVATVGPTNTNGFAKSASEILAGTYTVVETTFPANYTSNGTNSWSVKVTGGQTARVGGANGVVVNVLKKGGVGVLKVDTAGSPLSGVVFGVYSDQACTAKIGEMTTGADGKAMYGVNADGEFTLDCASKLYIKEIAAQSTDYILDAQAYPVSVVADTITWANNGNGIPNHLKNGALCAYKVDEDGAPLPGVVFGVYSDQACTTKIGEMTTDADGKAVYGVNSDGTYGVPCRQTLYVREISPKDDSYVLNDTVYEAPISADTMFVLNDGEAIVNFRKYWSLEVTKVDRASVRVNVGDISTQGAVYGLFNANDEKLAEYTTDENGTFTTGKFVAASGYYLKELVPPVGFRLDDSKIRLNNLVAPSVLTGTMSVVQKTVIESPITGNVSILKFTPPTSNADTNLIPEPGAEFVVYLSSFGSYEAAVASGDARLYDNCVIDTTGTGIWSNGNILSKDLAYGVYTVHQTRSTEGRIPADDFTVDIKEDGKVYSYSLNNRIYETTLVVNKTDAETGELIVGSPTRFKIRNVKTGEYVTVETKDVFDTVNGVLTFPIPLAYGNYELIEVAAPEGYVLNKQPIAFSVTEAPSAVTSIDVANTPQMGTIKVYKSGEVFSTVEVKDNFYQPVYQVKGLPGAEYTVTAAEDIVTKDGTVRYKKGDLVTVITTNADGYAETEPVYLGRYTVVETKAPFGMVLSKESQVVTLSYAGQDVTLTEASARFTNKRQKAVVSLTKELALNDVFGIGANQEMAEVRFGLFVADEFTASDGTSIPVDGLLEITGCDENGRATFSSDIPVGASLYVKELATDCHYVLSDEKHPVAFEYAGDDVSVVSLSVNDGKPVINDLIYGSVAGLKVDRETKKPIVGTLFGLFTADATEFTEVAAFATAVSGEDGSFAFDNIPYGRWCIKELRPAEGYLPNDENYFVEVNDNLSVIDIVVFNDLVPEIGTSATVGGAKEVFAADVCTIQDVVSFHHLVPGTEYVVKGVLMDKATGQPFVANGSTIYGESTFVPDAPSGEVLVSFVLDTQLITQDTELVVFEALYLNETELVVHADINDVDQTVTVLVPRIGTLASVKGEKVVTATDRVVITDVVSYQHLIPGKEYTIKGVLMAKELDSPFLVNGEEVRNEVVFVPETSAGQVEVLFTFDGNAITTPQELVVFEALFYDGVEMATHADIKDIGQTVLIRAKPAPSVPATNDRAPLSAVVALAASSFAIVVSKRRIKVRR